MTDLFRKLDLWTVVGAPSWLICTWGFQGVLEYSPEKVLLRLAVPSGANTALFERCVRDKNDRLRYEKVTFYVDHEKRTLTRV